MAKVSCPHCHSGKVRLEFGGQFHYNVTTSTKTPFSLYHCNRCNENFEVLGKPQKWNGRV